MLQTRNLEVRGIKKHSINKFSAQGLFYEDEIQFIGIGKNNRSKNLIVSGITIEIAELNVHEVNIKCMNENEFAFRSR